MSFFEGKTAIITGGCSGIGYGTAEHFLKQNIENIAILDLDDSKNVTEALQCSYKNQNVVFIKTDVSKRDQVESAFAEVISKFNFVDIVVANAGILREKDYELTVNVNLLGVLHTTYTAIDTMNKDKGRGGIIVSTASVTGLDGLYSMPVYSATKHAVVGLNRCFGHDYYLNKFGIKFVTICPGFADTAILDDLGNRLTEGTLNATLQVKETLQTQTGDDVGRCISEILIADAKNGSIWIVDGGKTREVTLQNYFLTN